MADIMDTAPGSSMSRWRQKSNHVVSPSPPNMPTKCTRVQTTTSAGPSRQDSPSKHTHAQEKNHQPVVIIEATKKRKLKSSHLTDLEVWDKSDDQIIGMFDSHPFSILVN